MSSEKSTPGGPMRVLALMPHPDDCEILCAGTLLLLREAGCEIHVATMTPGDKGSATLTRPEIAEIRRAEARSGAKALGAASCSCLEFADLEIEFNGDARRRVTGLLRRIAPHIVFTTPPVDYMADHEVTSRLVRDACFNAAVKNYATDREEGPTGEIPYLFYTDPVGGHDLFGIPAPVHTVVDVTAQMETKLAALACHDSQRSWLQKQHGMDDYLLSVREWASVRGRLIGAEYAEAFCQHLGHPHPADNPLEALVGAVQPSTA